MDPCEAFPPSLIEPKIVFVIGMHRSGTSALAHMINSLGAFVGEDKELVPADASINPAGYWERADIVTEQDGFLKSAGFAWGTLANFAIEQVAESHRRKLAVRLHRIVSELVHLGSTFVVKDPRLCLTLPVWHRFVTDPVHVVVVRDPRKVAASLMTAYPNSFTTDFLLALWQKYLQSALAALAGRRVLFVSYAHLIEDADVEYPRLWWGLNELGATGLSGFDPARAHEVLDDSLDRAEPSPQAQLDESQQRLFDWLMRHSRAPGPVEVVDVPPLLPPDAVLNELEQVRRMCMHNGWNMAMQHSAAGSAEAEPHA